MTADEIQSYIDQAQDLKSLISGQTGKQLMAINEDEIRYTLLDMGNPKECNSIQQLGIFQGRLEGLRHLDEQLDKIFRRAKEMSESIVEKPNSSA